MPRILVVDDEETFRESTADLLRHAGYNCDCAADRHSAEELLRHGQHELLIAVIPMPGGLELELVASARAVAEDTATLLVTDDPSLETAQAAMHLDVVGYLIKPFETDRFLECVVRGIGRSRARQMLRKAQAQLKQQAETPRLIGQPAPGPESLTGPTEVESFLTLTMTNINRSLHDLIHVASVSQIQAPGTDEQSTPLCSLFNCPRLDRLQGNILHTITVLEKTKHAFKSKDLGELRRKLAEVVTESGLNDWAVGNRGIGAGWSPESRSGGAENLGHPRTNQSDEP